MTASFLAWSYSRLKMFKECPGKLWHCAVAPKGHPDRAEYFESQPMRDGKEIDAALTARISRGTPLRLKFAAHEPMAAMIVATPGAKLTQVQLALDRAMKPVGYKDWDNAWVRVIYDLAIINPPYGYLWDWKNGQIWVDEDQNKLFATVGFHVYPEIEVFDTAYVWLKHDKISPKIYHRRELDELWHAFLPDVERMQVAYKEQHWPKTPSKRACKFCDANRMGLCKEAAVGYGG